MEEAKQETTTFQDRTQAELRIVRSDISKHLFRKQLLEDEATGFHPVPETYDPAKSPSA